MYEKKLRVTCADAHGINTDIISKAISIENFLLASGEIPQGYTRMDLLWLAVDMRKIEILADIEEDLSVIRESLRTVEFGDIEYNDP